MIRSAAVTAIVAVALLASARSAEAGTRITIGLYAPSAPFQGPSDRLQYITELASHLEQTAGGDRVVGRVFARASDFAAAVRKGEVQFAVMSATYGATTLLVHRVIGTTLHGRAHGQRWQLVVGPDVQSFSDLRGKTVALARIGSRETAFVTEVLLQGEVDRSYFGTMTLTPDSLSAVTLTKLGRAQAAFVPEGVDIPTGLRTLYRTRETPLPVFVAFGAADTNAIASFAERMLSFDGGRALPRLAGANKALAYDSLRAWFSGARKHAVMAAARPARFSPRDLLSHRSFEIPRFDPLELIGASAAWAPPKKKTAPPVDPAAPL